MQKAWDRIKELTEQNAWHRKGWRLGDLTPRQHLAHAQVELVELGDAPNEIEELADVFACLIAYAQKKGWSHEQVDEAIVRKLNKRFIAPDSASGAWI